MEQTINKVYSDVNIYLEDTIKGLLFVFNEEEGTNVKLEDLDIERMKEEIVDKILDEISFNQF